MLLESPPRVVIVDMDAARRSTLALTVAAVATVDVCENFHEARAALKKRPDILVASLRLGAYNGVHLALVARQQRESTHAIVYDAAIQMAPAVLHAGAFFELADRIAVALPAYVTAVLPASDRRDPNRSDRRNLPRGGRRRWDQYVLAAAQ